MFVHAQDTPQGILVSRHTAQGTVTESMREASSVVPAFYAAPCMRTPKLHLLGVEEGAQMPGLREREQLAELAGRSTVPRWVACVLPLRKARLAMDIVMMLAPARPARRIQAFDSTEAAVAWLLTPRPDAQRRLLEILNRV